jgi:hypothetical protein
VINGEDHLQPASKAPNQNKTNQTPIAAVLARRGAPVDKLQV